MSVDTEDFLAHYGIVGMKWGRRRGGLSSRVTSAAGDANQRRQEVVKRAATGKQTLEEKVLSAPIRLALGKKRFQKLANTTLGALKNQQARLDNGKMKAIDVLDAAYTMRPIDLVISRRDRKTKE